MHFQFYDIFRVTKNNSSLFYHLIFVQKTGVFSFIISVICHDGGSQHHDGR